jgi:methylthioribose-1-phosphate isomerase
MVKFPHQAVEFAETLKNNEIDFNHRMGAHGAKHIVENASGSGGARVTVLTHCNTGALATSGMGTALGVIKTLFTMDKLEKVYCTETRPYHQGSRLTAFELVYDGLPGCLICDDMAGALMKEKVQGDSDGTRLNN